jgi:membrane-associated protease RseP (regulator of RpoE activity)
MRAKKFYGWVGAMLILAGCATVSLAKEKPADAKDQKERKVIKIIKHCDSGEDCEKAGPARKAGFLGVHLIQLSRDLRSHFGAPEEAGVMVDEVEPDSPAAKAGVVVGDIITEADGQKVKSIWSLQRSIARKKQDEKISLKLVRDKQARELQATVLEREQPRAQVMVWENEGPDFENFDFDFSLDQQGIDEAVKEAQERFKDLKGKHIIKVKKIEQEMEKRVQEMEKRLQELEKKLQGSLAAPSFPKAT